jgi:23S rRNA pseudouridine1911/1915/1917 synthase
LAAILSEDKPIGHQFVVASSDAGQRLDVFLASKVDRLSRGRIQLLIRSGQIRLNGELVRARQSVRPGDRIQFCEPGPERIDLEPEDVALEVLYEDENLLVVNKPAGITVHPGAGIQSGTLVNALLHHAPTLSSIGGELRPGVVHRIDKETSGCIVVAKDNTSHLRLSAQFAARKIRKFYLALCVPGFVKSAGEIVKPIGRHPIHRQKMTLPSEDGRRGRDTKLFARRVGWLWYFVRSLLGERIRSVYTCALSGIRFWGTSCMERGLWTTEGKCYMPGVSVFFIR